MRRWRIIALLMLPLVILAALAVFVAKGDHRGRVERWVSRALDRRLTIAGRFEIDFGLTTRILVEDVSLASPDWSGEPAMIHVDRLEGSLDTWSLLRGPIRLQDLELRGVRMVLEQDAHGRNNWSFGSASRDRPSTQGARAAPSTPVDPGVVFEHAELFDIELVFRDASNPNPFDIAVDSLRLTIDPERMLDLRVSGRVNDMPVEVAGRLGTFDNLVTGGAVELELSGSIDEIEFTLNGRIAEPLQLGAPELELEMSGPDLSRVTERLGLPPAPPGAFRIRGRAAPSEDRVAVSVELDMSRLHASMDGVFPSLLDASTFSLDLEASSSELSSIGILNTVDGMPSGAVALTCTVVHSGGRLEVRDLHAVVGPNSLTADGILGAWPTMLGAELSFEAEGPDLAVYSTMTGTELPSQPYRVAGRVIRREVGIEIETLTARVGHTEIEAQGLIGDWPTFAGTTLHLDITCPDASVFGPFVGVDLPAAPVHIEGRIRPGTDVLLLEGIDAKLGRDTARIDGTIVSTDGFVGTDLRVRFFGPNPNHLATLAGIDYPLPEESFDLAGGVRVVDGGYMLTDVQLRFGQARLAMDGMLAGTSDLSGTHVSVHAAGPDISRVAALAGIEGWPVESFEIQGDVRIVPHGYELDSVEARLGDIAIDGGGFLGPVPDLAGTALRINGRGDDLSALAPYLGLAWLPSEPFSVRGRLERLLDGYRFDQVEARLGDHRIEGDGTLILADELEGTTIRAMISGSEISDAVRLLREAGLIELTTTQHGSYEVTGELRFASGGRTEWEELTARWGRASLRADGVLGRLPDGYGSDFRLDAERLDGAMVGAVLGFELPSELLSIHGSVQRDTTRTRLNDVRIRLGPYHAEIDGILGEPPKLIGTQLDVHIEGPDLAPLASLWEFPTTDQPFEVRAHFDGHPEVFRLDNFEATLGESDVRGHIEVDLVGKPFVRGELESTFLDISDLRPPEPVVVTADDTGAVEGSPGGFLISDEPLPLDWLDSFDADIAWHIEELEAQLIRFHAVEFEVDLVDRRLAVGPFRAEGETGGSIFGAILLEPHEDTYRATVTLEADQLRLALAAGAEDRERQSPHDGRVELQAVGRSLHELASTAEGRVVIFQGPGEIDLEDFGALTRDALSRLGQAMRLSSPNQAPWLECGAHVYNIEDGRVKLDPFALVTTRFKVIGRGIIDLKTERLDVAWSAKPRKGVGLSASAITNPYLKLGGTLSQPSFRLQPARAATTTAMAWTTAGLSLLAKGFWDRTTSGNKVCRKAKKKAGL